MKIIISLLIMALGYSAMADLHMLKESKYTYVKQSIGKGKPYFLEVGSDSCRSCKIMGEMLYKVVQKNPQYNIHFINVKKDRESAYELKIRMIPTQIIYDKNGTEVYRHIGVLATQELAEVFKKYNF